MSGLRKGYPGLTHTAEQIANFIGVCDIFCEPFAGLGRVSKRIKANKIILNDKSDYSVEYLKENFKNSIITQDDFVTSIIENDSPDTTFLFDPPWSRIDYAENPKTFCDRGVGVYYQQLALLVPSLKGRWFCAGRAGGGARSTVSVYFNKYSSVVIESDRKINGFNIKTKIYYKN